MILTGDLFEYRRCCLGADTEIFWKCRQTDVLKTLLPSCVIQRLCVCVCSVPAAIRLPHPQPPYSPRHTTVPTTIPHHLHVSTRWCCMYLINCRFAFYSILLISDTVTYSYTHVTLLHGLKLTSLHQASLRTD
jgi:hypothetical protein